MALQAPHWMSPQQARFFLALPDADARMQYIDQLRSMRLRNPSFNGANVKSELLPRLFQAAPRALQGWLNERPLDVDQVTRLAQARAAGKSLGKRDVGEKIGGARKDMAEIRRLAQLAAIEAQGAAVAYKAVTKAAVLGEFDVHAAKAAGDSAGCAFLKRELWRSIQTRPEDSPRARMRFVEGCAIVREESVACHTVEALYDWLEKWKWKTLRYEGEVAETISEAAFAARFPPPLRVEGIRQGPDLRELVQRAGYNSYRTQGGVVYLLRAPTREETARQDEIVTALGPRFYAAVHRRSPTRGYRHSSTTPAFHDELRTRARLYEQSQDWAWSDAGETPEDQPKTRDEFVFVRAGLTGARQGGPEVSDVSGARLTSTFGLRGLEHGNWMGTTDADTGERAAFGALLDLSLTLGLPAGAMGFQGRLGLALGARGGGKASAHYEPSRRVINLTKTRGAGTLAHEWGHALDHWLADPTGRAGKALFCSTGTPCGIPAVDAAFRGVMRAILGEVREASGRRRNPEAPVKLTPIESLDDYNERIRALNTWLREAESRFHAARKALDEPGLIAARAEFDLHKVTEAQLKRLWARFRNAEKKQQAPAQVVGRTTYLQDAIALGDYWSRPEELFARAWEATIEDMITSKGWLSGYLVAGTQARYRIPRRISKEEVRVCEVYPQGAERAAIGAAMQSLIRAIRESWT